MSGDGIAAIISAIGVIIIGYMRYNQHRHNKLIDIKAKKLEAQLERKSTRRSENSARVYGEIHHLLNALGCDRVFIIQPHPLGDNHYLSVLYEVTANRISRISEFFQDLKMSEIPKFSSMMAKNEYSLIRSIDELDGTRAKALFSSNGTKAMIVQRLSDTVHDWVGSLICDYTVGLPENMDPVETMKTLHFAAMHIQYILPEVSEKKCV